VDHSVQLLAFGMEGDQFVEWFSKVIVIATRNLQGSKLLIFDRHSSDISTQIVKLALENNTELFCLSLSTYTSSTGILQPLQSSRL